jgi:hypothetical protein
MHRYSLLSIILLLFIANITLGQRNRNKNTKPITDLRKIDTLLQPIPTNRSYFHLLIDDQIVLVDKLDGKYDGKVDNYRGPETDGIINNDILRRAKSLAAFIENETFAQEKGTNDQTKVRYLRKVEFDLKEFYAQAYTGNVMIDIYKDMFDELENLIVANKQGKLEEYVRANPNIGVYLNRSLLEDKPQLIEILIDTMCVRHPEIMEPKLREIAKYQGACIIVSNMAKRSISSVLNFATSTSIERDIVAKCGDPLVQSIYAIATKTQKPLKAIAFLNDYRSNVLTIQQIDDMTATDEAYYKALVGLRIDNKPENQYIINRDLKVQAQLYVREINELHDESNLAIRFKCLDNLSPRELYYLAVLCGDEIYTSSFTKGVFKNLITKMQPQSGNEFLQTIKMDKFRTFIRMCANYNTLDSFLATMSTGADKDVMSKFVKGLGDNNKIDLESSVDVADAFGSINNPKLIAELQADVRQEYEANYLSNNKDGMSVYFILYSLFTSKQEGGDDSLFDATMTNKLHLKPINKMPFKNLVAANNTVYEQVFFYGDKDGQDSYVSFKSFIAKFPNLKLDESNKYFTVIKSVNTKVPLEIYANKPLSEPQDEEAQRELGNYLVQNNIVPSIMIHRGHSYHLPETIKYFSEENKVCILGSCGSYQNLSTILTSSADAQIVSSKQVGSMHINDPIIREVNYAVMNGEEVNWVKIWSKLDKEFTNASSRDLFNDYVPPHKNLGALFLKAYKTLSAGSL